MEKPLGQQTTPVWEDLCSELGSSNTRELTLEKDSTNVMSVGKPSVAVLGSFITEEFTICRSSTTVKSMERPSARLWV